MFDWEAIRERGQFNTYDDWCRGTNTSVTQKFRVENPSKFLKEVIGIFEVVNLNNNQRLRFKKWALRPMVTTKPLEEWM